MLREQAKPATFSINLITEKGRVDANTGHTETHTHTQVNCYIGQLAKITLISLFTDLFTSQTILSVYINHVK